ncbi:MAG: cation transporter [Bacteroidia bacterium]|nr:cation transporter [Bacteroidia bacterium]
MEDHSSHHHHHEALALRQVGRAFIFGILLNGLFVLVEFAYGFYGNSLALLSDAGHNLGDVATLGLSLFAFQIAKRKANNRFTYGFQKGTILASLTNAVILLIAVGSIGLEAIYRLQHPIESKGVIISLVAGVGVIVNTVSALLFYKDQAKDLNIKGAYLHLLTDALVSIGVVITGVVIYYTGITWIDPLISIAIMIIVIYSTWDLLTESIKLSLDAVPMAINTEHIKNEMMKVSGVKNVHHIHIWAMATTKNALTAHIVLEKDLHENEIVTLKNKLRDKLYHLGIQHSTLETEITNCSAESCGD